MISTPAQKTNGFEICKTLDSYLAVFCEAVTSDRYHYNPEIYRQTVDAAKSAIDKLAPTQILCARVTDIEEELTVLLMSPKGKRTGSVSYKAARLSASARLGGSK
jgi:hypothetical protein